MSDVRQSIQSRVHLEDFTQFLLKPVGVREAIELAQELVQEVQWEQSSCWGDYRVERLARFVLHALRPDVTEQHCGAISMVSTGDQDGVAALRCGELVGLSPGMDQVGGASRARELATALLVCAELAESSEENQ